MIAVTPPGPTRERILRLADELFARHGYAAVSMRAVASAAGVTKPALYYHFRDKESLFEECIHSSQRRLGERLRRATAPSQDLRGQLVALTHTLLTATAHHPVRTHGDVTEHLSVEARRRLAEGFRSSVLAPLAEVFSAAAARGELRPGLSPGVAAAVLLGVALVFLDEADEVQWTSVRTDPGLATAEAAARLVADVVLGGVAS